MRPAVAAVVTAATHTLMSMPLMITTILTATTKVVAYAGPRAGTYAPRKGMIVSLITKLEDIAGDLYSIAAEHDNLVRVYAEDADDRWVNAYNFVVSAIAELEGK